mmetsp:Transcript_15699/g.33918  ORF Transcript_15699/g.33918 Transcript_15699/m.33918 type:complete len:85 (-) Transcript_15699:794-1048(-)
MAALPMQRSRPSAAEVKKGNNSMTTIRPPHKVVCQHRKNLFKRFLFRVNNTIPSTILQLNLILLSQLYFGFGFKIVPNEGSNSL